MNKTPGVLLIFLCILFAFCHPVEQPFHLDLNPIKNLILFDRSAVVTFDQDIERILKQRDSIYLPALNVYAYAFAWGGETGGRWHRVISFFRPSPDKTQCEFYYSGEYELSMMNVAHKPLKSGINHYLGKQLTQVGNNLGDEIRLDKGKMTMLLVTVMEQLLGCQRIRKSYMDSLDTTIKTFGMDGKFDFSFQVNSKFMETIQRAKAQMTHNPDPDVFFFHGELINGIWKGTVRQLDHTGRFCIELEYLNGEFAYTLWL